MANDEALPLDMNAFALEDLDEPSRERIQRMTPDEWYRRGVGALLDGVVFLAMKHRKGSATWIRRALMLRHVRSLDAHAHLHPISRKVEPAERLARVAEQARFYVMRRYPELRAVLKGAMWMLLRQEAPLASPENPLGWRDGLTGAQLDPILRVIGLELCERYRMQALRELAAAGAVGVNTAHRWHVLNLEGFPQCAETMARYHRYCFLSMMDRVTIQRFMGETGALWFMGFQGTAERRREMLLRLTAGAQAWLRSHCLPLAQVQEGQEAELVWVQTGLLLTPQARERRPLPDGLVRELEFSLVPAVQARLGLGDEGADLMRRALADRERHYQEQCQQLEQRRREDLGLEGADAVALPPPCLDMTPSTREHWQSLPSFETDELKRLFSRGKVPAAMLKVLACLLDAHPKARTVYEIYEQAQQSWPEELCNTELIESACRRLEAFHLVAENGVQLKDSPSGKKRWGRGYKALQLKPSRRPATNKEQLSTRLADAVMSLAEADEESPPHITTLLYILRRTDVPAYIEELRRLRDLERSIVIESGENHFSDGEESLLCIQVALDPLKAVNCI